MKLVRSLMSGAALVAMPIAAHAQDAAGQAGADQAAAEQESMTAAAAVDEGEEDAIVVTATRRNQIAQDVPIAVSVVGGEQIQNAGVVDIRGIRQLTSSLQATTGQSSATGVVLSIRGIGTAGDNPGFEPAVGVFVDGVFRARAGLALAELPPIERVEVLRGPQGTLFGRNTSAGALSIVTQGPEFTPGGYAEISYGNYDEVELKAGVTAPLSNLFAVRVDGGYHRRDGYIQDVNSDRSLNNLDRWYVRGQGLFENENLSIRLIADYYKTDENCCGAIHVTPGITGTVVQTLAGLAGNVGFPTEHDPENREMAISPNRDFLERVNEWGLSAEINYDFGGAKLTSITAYRDWDARRNQDIDFSGLDRAYRDNYRTGLTDFTQEIRLQGDAFAGKLDWLVGAFYLNETLDLTDTVRLGTQAEQYVDALLGGATRVPGLAPNGFSMFGSLPGRPFVGNLLLAQSAALRAAVAANPALAPQFLNALPGYGGGGQNTDQFRVDTDAFALFTHNIFNITDDLSLTVGVRYNHERKRLSADLNAVNPACSALLPGGSHAFFGSALASNPAFESIRLLVCNPTVNPEFNGRYSDKRSESEITGTAKLAYKITPDVLLYGGYDRGFKSGGYNLDRGGFDSRYFGGNGAQADDLEFGPEKVDAFEIGLKTELARGVTFNATAFYQDFSGYQNLRFEGSSFVVRQYDEVISQGIELETNIRPAPDVLMRLGYTYLDAEIHDVAAGLDNGKQLTNQPHNVVTGGVTWTPQLSDGIGGLVHVDFRYNSAANVINSPADGAAATRNGAYSIWNARVGVNFANDRFGIEAYVRNIFNQYYNITGFPVPEQTGAYAVYPSPPRFYGLKLRASF